MQSKWSIEKLGNVVEDLTSSRFFEVGDNDKIIEPTISSKTHTIDTRKELLGKDVRVKKRVKLLPGDLIFARLHTQNGLFAFCDKEYIATQTFVPVKINEKKIDREYLFFALRVFIKNLAASGDSVGRETYKPRQILDLEIPLLPLPEQKRLVAKIKEIEEKVGGIKKESQLLRSRGSNITKTIAEHIFEKIKSVVKLGELTSRITKGESPKWQGFNYQNDGPLFITSENVLWGNIDISEAKHIPPKFHQKLKRSQVNRGDLLVNLVGASIGRAALVREELGDANINQAVAVITTNSKKILPEYVLRFLLSPVAQERIQASRVETARPNISLSDLRKLEIPFVDIEEQKRIVKYLSAIEEKQRSLNQEIEKRNMLSTALLPSVLSKAFRGELLSQ